MEDLLREQEGEERLRQRESQKQPVELDQVRPLARGFFYSWLILLLLTCGSAEASSDLLKLTKGAEAEARDIARTLLHCIQCQFGKLASRSQT